MKWSEQAWQQSKFIYNRIINMPFNQELMQGTLPVEKFKFYIGQDAVYLGAFSRALSLIAARSYTLPQTLAFIKFAEGAVVVEKALHEAYFKQFSINGLPAISPTCQNYTQFLLTKAALDDVAVAMAAVLPCFWIYKKTGDYIYHHNTSNNNPYQAWIDTYAGEEFKQVVDEAIAICDEVAQHCSPQQQNNMWQAYIMASKLEYMFWDSAYRLEQWPV